MLKHYQHCALDGVYRYYGCGVCGIDFGEPEVAFEDKGSWASKVHNDLPCFEHEQVNHEAEWGFVKHIMPWVNDILHLRNIHKQ